jgi:hypothetical protein
MLDALNGWTDRRLTAAIVAIIGGAAAVAIVGLRSSDRAPEPAPPRAIAIRPQTPIVAAPLCDRAARAPRTYFQPLPSGPLAGELHHIDNYGMVDLDCDGVGDYVARHVAPEGPELFVSSYLHRRRFYDYRIPLVTAESVCEARVTVDESAVEIVLTWTSGARCDHIDRVEHYAIREHRLYRDGKFVRDGT